MPGCDHKTRVVRAGQALYQIHSVLTGSPGPSKAERNEHYMRVCLAAWGAAGTIWLRQFFEIGTCLRSG
ncbi:hypothetical protein EMIT0P265_300007 [Pseudomonas zeae]